MYGAEVIFTDPLDGSDAPSGRPASSRPHGPTSTGTPISTTTRPNARAHYVTTAEEIWRQTGGRVTHLVAGVGTTGTLMGTAAFKRVEPRDRARRSATDGPFHGLEG